MLWRRNKHSCFVFRGQAVRSHLVWEIISDWESLEALGGFDRKLLKACGRQDPRRVPAPLQRWNKDQVVIRAECCVCRQGPSPCQGSSTAPNPHIVALFAKLLAELGGAVLHPSSLPQGYHCEGSSTKFMDPKEWDSRKDPKEREQAQEGG